MWSWVYDGSTEATEWLKSTYGKIQLETAKSQQLGRCSSDFAKICSAVGHYGSAELVS